MPISTITVGGQSVNLVALPTTPGVRQCDFSFADKVGIVTSIFTGQVQAQQWPGADALSATVTLPPMKFAQGDAWISALLQLRGMANALQMGDPSKKTPRGSVLGSPAVDNSVAGGNAAMAQSIGTKGWSAGAAGVLLSGDYIQVGFRLHRVLDDVTADGSGKALIPISPSLREIPTDSSAIVTSNTQGLFRLARNERTWSVDYTKLVHISFPIVEYR